MMRLTATGYSALFLLAGLACSRAWAALPAPTPAQQQSQALAAQQAAAATDKAKQELAASMEQVSTRWRARASQNGWTVNPATATAATGTAGNAPAAPGGTGGKPAVRSEKQGTAPPSADVKDPSKKGL